MPLTNAQYNRIQQDYDNRRTKNRHLSEQRMEEVYKRIPSYRALEDETASFSVSQGKKYLLGDAKALDSLSEKLAALSSEKAKLLTDAGFPADYLAPIYTCPDCKDTGYIDGKKCHCFKQAEIDLLYQQSRIRDVLERENFQTLSYEYFEGEDLERFRKAVDFCRLFINGFSSTYKNLFLYGTVGTGKSFLSNCIAKELIETGHSVLYFSATDLFDTLSKYTFDKENQQENYGDISECDLLIIDDLGTEYANQFVSTQLFSLLNDRHMQQKSTLISTNLSLEDLRERYSDRIFSRITGYYELCKLTGPDIRMTRKRMQNRK